MGKGSRWLGLVVSLALIFVMTVGTISAQASIYRIGKYDIYYYNDKEYGWAKSLAAYVPEAWRAAYTVIGKKMLYGQMQVRFYSTKTSQQGFLKYGTQNIYLNGYNLFSISRTWGSTLANKTAIVLFYNYTKAINWRGTYMSNYRTFISESLARYTGDVAYNKGRVYSAADVKSYLQYYNKRAYGGRSFMSWYGMGFYHNSRNGDLLRTAQMGQIATGYFLTGGLKYRTSSTVERLMYYMRVYSSYAGSYLRSSNKYTAQNYFEYTFQRATGYRANAGLIYGRICNTDYLMGKFYNQWYL